MSTRKERITLVLKASLKRLEEVREYTRCVECCTEDVEEALFIMIRELDPTFRKGAEE
jgi:hypothetical protein